MRVIEHGVICLGILTGLLTVSKVASAEGQYCGSNTVELTEKSVQPDGWLRECLTRQISGLTGHPAEMGFPFNTGMWAARLNVKDREYNKYGENWWPYEQTAYYLDGALRCAYLMQDTNLLGHVSQQIESVLANVKKDGRLGTLNVDNDKWPMVVLMRMLLAEYEISRDAKLLAAIERHYEAIYPDQAPLPNFSKSSGFNIRQVLHVENLCHLALLTGKTKYVTLAERLYQKFCADKPGKSTTAESMFKGEVSREHAVTYHCFLALPAILYKATGNSFYRQAAEKAFEMLEKNHELVDGLSSGHEELAGKRSDKVHETCNATDFIWTLGFMLEATGEGKYADKLEKVLFNAGLGSVTKDFKAHQYYSGPNQVILTDKSSHWNFNSEWGRLSSGGRMCYRPGHDTECCSGNIHRMVPAFVKRMWLVDKSSTAVTAALYAPCKVVIPFPDGAPLTIRENTGYPFENRVEFVFSSEKPRRLTFRMRIPGWSKGFTILLNGSAVNVAKGSDSFVAICREFRAGDKIELSIAAEPLVTRTKGGISVSYGALVFSLPIKADVRKYTTLPKSSEAFPAYEQLPVSEWNFGLSAKLAANDIRVVKEAVSGTYPWDEGTSPVRLFVKARRVSNWVIGDKPYTPDIPEKPLVTGEECELELRPLGATLLRVTEFPEVD